MLMSEYLARRELALDILAACLQEGRDVEYKFGCRNYNSRPGRALWAAEMMASCTWPYPKVSRQQRLEIVNPDIGTLVWDKDDLCVYMFMGPTGWFAHPREKRPPPRDKSPLPLP